MKEYQVTVTYLITVEANNSSDAEQEAMSLIEMNQWEPNDIEVEEIK